MEIPGVTTNKTYENDYACIWKLPSPGTCKRYEIKIARMNLKGAVSCECADHVLLHYSRDQTKCFNGKSVGTGITSICTYSVTCSLVSIHS